MQNVGASMFKYFYKWDLMTSGPDRRHFTPTCHFLREEKPILYLCSKNRENCVFVPTQQKNVIATKNLVVDFVQKDETPPPVELIIKLTAAATRFLCWMVLICDINICYYRRYILFNFV